MATQPILESMVTNNQNRKKLTQIQRVRVNLNYWTKGNGCCDDNSSNNLATQFGSRYKGDYNLLKKITHLKGVLSETLLISLSESRIEVKRRRKPLMEADKSIQWHGRATCESGQNAAEMG